MGKRKYKEHKRNCPDCGIELTYKTPDGFYLAMKKNSRCRPCGARIQYVNNPEKNKGTLNGRFGKSLAQAMEDKHGNNWKQVYDEWKSNLHKFKSGKDNPAYGKIYNGGKGFKGFYRSVYFRSSFELVFLMLFYLKNSFLPESAEQDCFRLYLENQTIVPDFYCAKCNTIYEIKLEAFLNREEVKFKIEKSKKFIENLGYSYKLITDSYFNITTADWRKMPIFVRELLSYGVIELTKKSKQRVKRYKYSFEQFDSGYLNKLREIFCMKNLNDL
ncbi:MAG TPA: hypothetical protein PLP33_25310 [Leptospiraceae bacterium]|nr:hypothetical protein [Leptospiraceae bacterium]